MNYTPFDNLTNDELIRKVCCDTNSDSLHIALAGRLQEALEEIEVLKGDLGR